MVIGAIIIAGCLHCYFSTRERVKPIDEKEEKISAKSALMMLVKNKSWLQNSVFTLLYFSSNIVVTSSIAYYATYVLKAPGRVTAILGAFAAGSLLILPMVSSASKRYGRRVSMVCGSSLLILSKVVFLLNPRSLAFAAVGGLIMGMSVGFNIVLFSTNRADLNDLLEWKHGRRIENVMSTLSGFVAKCGSSVASLMVGFGLQLTGYVAGAAEQTAGTINMIISYQSAVPLVFGIIMLLISLKVKLDEEVARMNAEKAGAFPRQQAGPIEPLFREKSIVGVYSMLDILITNATILDGTGAARRRGSVGIEDGKITYVGPSLPEAIEVLDIQGHVVAPGFIDVHGHSDLFAFIDPLRDSKLKQGITTEIAGQCGLGPAPVSRRHLDAYHGYFERQGIPAYPDCAGFTSIGAYMDYMETMSLGINLALFIPHGALRMAVMGLSPACPGTREIHAMKALVEEGMRSGALGLSTGLMYAPGSFAEREEIEALCKVVGKFGGIYTSHIRNQGALLVESVAETLDVGRRTGARVNISHHKPPESELGQGGYNLPHVG